MSAEFYDILAPPQTLESLGNWGRLDDLPWSLDDAIWGSAGVYGFTVSEGGLGGGEMRGAQRVRSLALGGKAGAGGSMQGEKDNKAYDLAGRMEAVSGGHGILARVFILAGLGTGRPNGEIQVGRVCHVAMTGACHAGVDARFTFKGWGWAQKAGNEAEWAAQSVPAQGWTQRNGGTAQWR